MRRSLVLVVLGLAAVVLAGSAVGARSSTAAGFERHAVPGHGMSLTVPEPWVVVDSRLPQSVVDRLSRENPRLAPFMAVLSQPGSPIRFIALDPAVRDSFATNVNVVVAPVPAGLSLAQYQTALASELRTVGVRNLQKSLVTVGGVRAVRLSYRFQLSLGRTFTVQTLQYAFLRSGKSIVVTYTTLPKHAARYQATFKRSAGSIRFST